MDSMICFQDQQDQGELCKSLREAVKNYLANCPAVFLSYFSLWICYEIQLTTNTKIQMSQTSRLSRAINVFPSFRLSVSPSFSLSVFLSFRLSIFLSFSFSYSYFIGACPGIIWGLISSFRGSLGDG